MNKKEIYSELEKIRLKFKLYRKYLTEEEFEEGMERFDSLYMKLGEEIENEKNRGLKK